MSGVATRRVHGRGSTTRGTSTARWSPAAGRFARPDAERDIDVGYRGRPLQPFMGSGSLEKVEIGERFKELAAATALRADIDTSERGRIYGDDWYRFLGRCRAVLGVESGTSYLDLEDEVYRDYRARLADGRPVTLEALLAGAAGAMGSQLLVPHDQSAALRSGGVQDLPGHVRGRVLGRAAADGPLHPAARRTSRTSTR